MADYPLTAAAIKQEFKRAGIHFVVALPDRVTSHYLLKGLLADPDYKVVQVCKEDEGVSICSGLYAAGHKSVLMMQYTGFLDSINSIRGIAIEGKFPVCIIVGLLARGAGPETAALWSVYVHGEAGRRLGRRYGGIGYLAREIPNEIPSILAEVLV